MASRREPNRIALLRAPSPQGGRGKAVPALAGNEDGFRPKRRRKVVAVGNETLQSAIYCRGTFDWIAGPLLSKNERQKLCRGHRRPADPSGCGPRLLAYLISQFLNMRSQYSMEALAAGFITTSCSGDLRGAIVFYARAGSHRPRDLSDNTSAGSFAGKRSTVANRGLVASPCASSPISSRRSRRLVRFMKNSIRRALCVLVARPAGYG